jgi:hypothetical protein
MCPAPLMMQQQGHARILKIVDQMQQGTQMHGAATVMPALSAIELA